MKTEPLSNAIYKLVASLCNTCGAARIYEMAALVTHLLELRQTLALYTQDTDLIEADITSEDFEKFGDEMEGAVLKATSNHAFMVNNRRDCPQDEVSLVSSDIYTSDLVYNDASPSDTECALYQQLRQNVADIPQLGTRIPYPLCECAILLSVDIDKQTDTLARMLRMKSKNESLQQRDLDYFIHRTIDAGFMDESGQWEPSVTRFQIAYWVDRVARTLNISQHWKWASHRWNLPTLAPYQSRNLAGSNIPAREIIDRIFS